MSPSLETVNPSGFRTAYRTALAWFYREENPELFHEYRFPDGAWLKSYLHSDA